MLPARESSDREADGDLDRIRDHILRGEFPVARAFLKQLREHRWDTLSPRQRWRACTLQADIEMREGRGEEAARLLFDARDQQPEDEVAIANAISAHELLGDPERARAVAEEARARFPNSGIIFGSCIQTARDDEEFARLLAEIPPQLAKHAKVWAGVAMRTEAIASTQLAENAARKATAIIPDNPRTWFALGSVLLRTEARKLNPEAAPQRENPDGGRLAEADACFTKVVDLTRGSDAVFAASALVRRAATRDFSGRGPEAQADIDDAFKLAPSDTGVRVAYARLLADRGNKEASIRALREALVGAPAHETRFLLGMSLCDRNVGDDRLEGARLLRGCATETGDHAETALLYAVEAYLSLEMSDEAATVLGAVPHADEALVATLRARVSLVRKLDDEAIAQATRAIGLVAPSTSLDALRKLGKVLASLKRFRESFEIWQRIATPGKVTEDTRWLVETAILCGLDAVVLQIGKEARDRGEYDPQLMDLELGRLDRYDPNEAAEVLREALERKPDDKRARLNLALLALRLPRSDLGVASLNQLPSIREASAQEGAAVVQVLVATGRQSEAREYAYDLLRRHFGSVLAHRAFWHAMLPAVRGDEERSVDPEAAGPGTAACYVEPGSTQQKWVVLEDSTVEATDVPEELLARSPRAKAFEGKRVGDTVVLATGIAQDRTATLQAVITKFAHRLQDVMNNWELRFPEHKEVAMVNVAGEGGHIDIAPFVRIAERTQTRTKEAEELYRTKPLGIWLFGQALGQDEIHAAIHLASADGQVFRCCVGSEAEDREAIAAFDTATEVVLDPTAIATVLLLGQLPRLDELGKQVVISHGTFMALQALLRNARDRARSLGTFGSTPTGQPAFTVVPEEHKKSAVEAASRLVELATTRWRVEGSRKLAAIEPELRELLFNGFGEAALQSASIASSPNRVLWTDDAAVAAMAKEQFGTHRIWTQSLLRRQLGAKVIDEETFVRASAGLIALRYHFTSVTPETLRRAAEWADWGDRSPMREVLDYLASPHTRTADAANLGAALVAFGYRDIVLPEKRRTTLISVAEAIGRRQDATQAVVIMGLALPSMFGLDALGQVDAMQTFVAWKVTFDRRFRAVSPLSH